MQTFLPYADFAQSMRVLDASRLGNQIWREGITLLRGRWQNHPASRMWVGYSDALAAYLNAGVQELLHRGRDYSDRPWACEILEYNVVDPAMPPWLGDEVFHASHRSNLLRKDPDHYRQFGWNEPANLPYVWPGGR